MENQKRTVIFFHKKNCEKSINMGKEAEDLSNIYNFNLYILDFDKDVDEEFKSKIKVLPSFATGYTPFAMFFGNTIEELLNFAKY